MLKFCANGFVFSSHTYISNQKYLISYIKNIRNTSLYYKYQTISVAELQWPYHLTGCRLRYAQASQNTYLGITDSNRPADYFSVYFVYALDEMVWIDYQLDIQFDTAQF
jgi:hypothetical protein